MQLRFWAVVPPTFQCLNQGKVLGSRKRPENFSLIVCIQQASEDPIFSLPPYRHASTKAAIADCRIGVTPSERLGEQ